MLRMACVVPIRNRRYLMPENPVDASDTRSTDDCPCVSHGAELFHRHEKVHDNPLECRWCAVLDCLQDRSDRRG